MTSGGEDEGAADHFERLSDDVVLVIFNKLWDAKLLRRCSTVCKRFSSLTPRVENLSLSLPSLTKPTFPKKIINWFLNFFRKPPPNPPKPPRQKKPPSPFDILLEESNLSLPLSQFEAIRRIQLELPPYSDAVVGDDYFIWGATKPGYKLQCFALLALTSLDYDPSDEVELLGTQITRNEFNRRLQLVGVCLINAIRRRWLMEALIRNYPELVSIAINDVNELGVRHCVSGGKLAELKALVDSLPPEMILDDDFNLVKWKIWSLCSLRLPVSGGVMEGVTLLVLEFGDASGGGGGGCSDAAIMGCFEEEDEAFVEAVAEILTKHKDDVYEYLY